MSKVKLVFCKSFIDVPSFTDTFARTLDIDSPFDVFHLIGARVFDHTIDRSDIPHSSQDDAIVTEYRDYSGLLGRLLTYVDATFTDPEQRKAHKDIIKKMVWDFEAELRERARQTLDSHANSELSNEEIKQQVSSKK